MIALPKTFALDRDPLAAFRSAERPPSTDAPFFRQNTMCGNSLRAQTKFEQEQRGALPIPANLESRSLPACRLTGFFKAQMFRFQKYMKNCVLLLPNLASQTDLHATPVT